MRLRCKGMPSLPVTLHVGDGGCCAPSVVAPQPPIVPLPAFCEPPGRADRDKPARAGGMVANSLPSWQLQAHLLATLHCARGQKRVGEAPRAASKLGRGVGMGGCKRWRRGLQPLPVTPVQLVSAWDHFLAANLAADTCAGLNLQYMRHHHVRHA
jgi:hypothetical protein